MMAIMLPSIADVINAPCCAEEKAEAVKLISGITELTNMIIN